MVITAVVLILDFMRNLIEEEGSSLQGLSSFNHIITAITIVIIVIVKTTITTRTIVNFEWASLVAFRRFIISILVIIAFALDFDTSFITVNRTNFTKHSFELDEA